MSDDEQQASLFGTDGPRPSANRPRKVPSRATAAPGFSSGDDTAAVEAQPLAARMRPRTLDEIVGQEHLLGLARLLRRAIESDTVPSMILWGPPGSGKTTLASVIARTTHAHFVALSAVTAGVAELRSVVEDAAKLRTA